MRSYMHFYKHICFSYSFFFFAFIADRQTKQVNLQARICIGNEVLPKNNITSMYFVQAIKYDL